MAPLSLEAKLIAWALGLLALLAGLGLAIHHERAIGEQKAIQAQAQAASAAEANNAIESARRESVQQWNLHEADKFNAQAAADARDLGSVVQRVHVAAASGRLAPAHPAAAPGGSPTSAPAVVSADLFQSLVDRAAGLAEYADSARIAGQLCARDYDALSH